MLRLIHLHVVDVHQCLFLKYTFSFSHPHFSYFIRLFFSQAPQTKEELIRELQLQRANEEAATAEKKKLEEQRLLVNKKIQN